MDPRRRREQRPRLPGRSGHPKISARNTLNSTQLPTFPFPTPAFPRQSSGSFRVPSPSESDDEEPLGQEASAEEDLPSRSSANAPQTPNKSSLLAYSDHPSRLGDSSSLFSERTPESTQWKGQPLGFGLLEPVSLYFQIDLPLTSQMAIEREPPKVTPKNGNQHPANTGQPEFGKATPLRNQLQPSNVFNVPKASQPRPEHHRAAQPAHSHLQEVKDFAHKLVAPVHSHKPLEAFKPPSRNPDVVEIPRPSNGPAWNSYARPPQTFSAINSGSDGFTSVNAFNPKNRPVVDLTKPQDFTYLSDPHLLGESFGDEDPYLYIDQAKANENIKALLEGAFDDDDDKPRTRGRKKKIEEAVEGITDRLKGLEVKPEVEKDAEESEEEEIIDDGTVEGLAVKLLPHQVAGVQWMRDKESGAKKKNGILPKGGILADDMGLGKTIQSLALILTNPRPVVSNATSVTDKKAIPPSAGKATLVVAPLALIKQWEGEIKNRVLDSHKMRVCVHHGPQRTKRFEDLKKYDVVITTYQILVSEHGSSSGRQDGPQVGCFGIHWYRLILDEAHMIKNRNAKATQACYALRAEYRWCLTGTPMQNNLDELQSLIKFLRIKPYNELSVWKDQITRPMSQGKGGVAIKRLQIYLQAFMKRRTKDILKQEGALNPGGKSTSGLGPSNGFKITAREIENVVAEFSPEERTFYERLEKRTDASLEQMMSGEKMSYASALVLLLRLRQACNHPKLVGGDMVDDGDALTTGQSTASQSSSKSKAVEKDVDDMADLLGGLTMQSKQCDVCQMKLSTHETSSGMTRCAECEDNLASLASQETTSFKEKKRHHSSRKTKPEIQKEAKHRHRSIIDDSSDEEEKSGDWLVPESERHALNLGQAGGSDDENAEGGGVSIASSDTDSDDESSVQVSSAREKKVINLDEEESTSSDSQPPSTKQPTPITSAKIRHLLTILNRETAAHKTIVFSQFTSMLDLIEPFLRAASLDFTRYDGSMRNDAREASLHSLRTNPRIRILLCSLKCGSLGLNLTAASRVVILEPFWNPFVEEQAIDRVHRLNQTQDVKVYKLTIKGSVEERILELQEKKRMLANAAIEGKKETGKLSMKDILNLFRRDAEHDGRHAGEDSAALGEKTRVLNGYGTGPPPGAEQRREGSGGRPTPPVMEKPRVGAGARREDPVYGRRW